MVVGPIGLSNGDGDAADADADASRLDCGSKRIGEAEEMGVIMDFMTAVSSES
ncbi:hypothetical protein [Sphingomonas fuzhouensis]|uniref:hypothetical protein n=1 Tax=Sphingomonas fuzhouensis TaxID=3106033 RepID=UPI002AFEDDB8|nr:hypothetical protein [Sphingomonas sp. SGZ-02]